jgi:uncharacterized membrane protein
MRFIWEYVPVFIIWLTGLSMMDNALHLIMPPLTYVAWLSLVPLFTSLILLAFALTREHGSVPLKRYLLWAMILVGIYAIPLLPRASAPLSLDTLRLIFEASAFVEFIILALHGRTWLKGWDWLWVYGVTLVFGMILENGGIIMGFFREEGYRYYLFGLPAPVATMLGWVNVLYCGFFAVRKLLPEMRPIVKGFVCAGIALAMDIPFDPVATRLGWWVWNDTLMLSIWGVPVVNYVAWFWALFPYAWCYHWVRRSGGNLSERKKIALLSALIPLILVVELGGVVISLVALGDYGAIGIIRDFFRKSLP